jgi:transcriptional regulator with XRE-family HTH domain
MDKIAVIITNLRKEKNWSQTDLANQSSVSREMISKYERGIAIPSVDAAKKIADAFGVSLDYLVGEGINSSFDKQTLQRLQEIQGMKPDFKVHLFSIIDSVIRDYKTQQAYSNR